MSNPNCGKPEMGRDVGRPESSPDADAVVHDLVMAEYILRPVPAGTNGSVQQFAPVLGEVQSCTPQGDEWSPECDIDMVANAAAANVFRRRLPLRGRTTSSSISDQLGGSMK
ncbi:hypothetical protein [Mycobacterium interjectum]|uniref:hypothetical protein n=1 Tax=Mycobacterium interjectum TaxID=33895 RepID=UPI000837597C|nr:hypothetical protein [Mycobacterium interjectum]MCV7091605.1 hypothetical protein [Mycobacterium interjectum]